MTKKLLITGGSGYLGRHLARKAAETFAVYATYHTRAGRTSAGRPLSLDLTDRSAVIDLIEKIKPEAIIHTAALNPGGDERLMMEVNAAGSGYVAEGAAAVGARLVHVSSDTVHNGREAPYPDTAPPAPIYTYGRSKAAAEARVSRLAPQAAIVRTSLIYGLQEMDNGTRSFADRLESGSRVLLFEDVIRQPIWVETLSAALLKLVEIDFSGPLNIAGRQAMTRAEFGRRMLAYWGVAGGDLLGVGRAAAISDTIPLDLRLIIAPAEQLVGMPFPGVDEVVAGSENRPPPA